MLMGAHNRRIDKDVARCGAILCLEGLPESAPEPTHFPAAKAVVHRVPASKILRQVAPGQSCPGEIQHCLDKQAITEPWRTASARFQGGEEGAISAHALSVSSKRTDIKFSFLRNRYSGGNVAQIVNSSTRP